MVAPLRKRTPKRSNPKAKAHYRQHKVTLQTDFDSRCGYCDSHEKYSGGKRNYQIDHFAPKKQFSDLEHKYHNLVYSCFYCNNKKSNTWPSNDPNISVVDDEGFIDPCDDGYDMHFKRNEHGAIVGVTKLGRYMHLNLNLGLCRHQLIWLMEKADQLIRILDSTLDDKDSLSDEQRINMLEKHRYISNKWKAYFEELNNT